MIMTLEKPNFGEACNGCGTCCKAVPCPVARDVIGAREGPCPALEFDDGRHWCGLIRNAHKHIFGLEDKPWASEPIREMLLASGAWQGQCDSDWPSLLLLPHRPRRDEP